MMEWQEKTSFEQAEQVRHVDCDQHASQLIVTQSRKLKWLRPLASPWAPFLVAPQFQGTYLSHLKKSLDPRFHQYLYIYTRYIYTSITKVSILAVAAPKCIHLRRVHRPSSTIMPFSAVVLWWCTLRQTRNQSHKMSECVVKM